MNLAGDNIGSSAGFVSRQRKARM